MKQLPRAILFLFIAICAAPSSGAALFGARRTRGSNSSITLRKRLHVNTLITDPGTVELDWSNLFSTSTGDFSMPSAIKYTPEGTSIPWGRTEYSVAFDTVTTSGAGANQLVRFSQAITVTATSVLLDGAKFDVAIAPQASFFLRDDSGARLGAVAIARYDSGRNSTGLTLSWSGATRSSPDNPEGTLDAGFGYGRNLSGSALAEKFTPHCNAIWEKSTGQLSTVALFEGIEFQMTDRVAFDLSGQHFSVSGSSPDNQIVFGITVSVGRLH